MTGDVMAKSETGRGRAPGRVLVVEDDQISATLLKMALERDGLERSRDAGGGADVRPPP